MMMVNDFKKEVLEWAQELRVNPKEIHVRPMKRKWASCSSKGRVTFSYELLNKSFEQRAKAIVHELLHLKYNSHNKMFASLLSAHLAKKGIKVSSVVL